MGIRAKLIASLSPILIALTLILGAVFAHREQQALWELRRDHLEHSAELASAVLAMIGPENAQVAIDALNEIPVAGPRVRFTQRTTPLTQSSDESRSSTGQAEVLSVSVPLRPDTGGTSMPAERLLVEEQLPDMRAELLATLRGHVALGALLTIAAVLAVAVVCQRLVVQPVQWLVRAADSMARGDSWEAIQPSSRKRDELGILSNHLTELSRRLSGAVRSARHSSARLVAEGVRRDMAEPIRQLSVALSILEAATAGEIDMEPRFRVIERHLNLLEHLAERLRDTGVET